ncbi:MAG: DHA2 family efflux MFS transporter permease subunit [Sphingomonadaceae bacterium]|nr:DHA2 family efflux MFS transporter permease subunit [Sphingomonadaceae bacterium]
MASAAAQPGKPPPAGAVAPPLADEPLLPVANHALLLVGIMLASLIQILDTTIANVALPHMQSALGATPESVTWVLTSYIVASAVAMPITGWLADHIGARRLFILSTAGFVVTSMACGLAQNLEEMVLFRTAQGITGAFIGPLSQSFMLDTSRPSKHPQMMALWGMGVMIGPIMGPVLGGWLTENFSWRWVFFVNLPLGAISLAIMLAALPKRPAEKRKFDMSGFLIVGLALASLQLLLDRGMQIDWFASGEAWIYAGIILSCLWMGAVHFSTTKNSLFDPHLFADRNFVISCGFILIVGCVMYANMALFAPMMQNLLGYSVIETGWLMMPRGIGVMISMQLAGLLMRRGVDARILVAFGFVLTIASLWEMTSWSLDVDSSHIVWTGIVQGLGIGLIFMPLNSVAFITLPPRLRTDGSSLLSLMRSLGGSVGISVATVNFAHSLQTSHSDLTGHVTNATTSSIDFSAVDRFQGIGDVVMVTLDGMINRQAAMIAYLNDFYLMMWMSIAALPLLFFMKTKR